MASGSYFSMLLILDPSIYFHIILIGSSFRKLCLSLRKPCLVQGSFGISYALTFLTSGEAGSLKAKVEFGFTSFFQVSRYLVFQLLCNFILNS